MAEVMNNFKIDVFLKKTSREYILLSTFERKTAFLAIFQPKCAQNCPFFSPLSFIPGGLEGLFDFYDPLHHHPWTGRPPRQESAHQAVLKLPTRSLALSKCRSKASDYGRGMTKSLPLSYWLPDKSNMTSSCTAM